MQSYMPYQIMFPVTGQKLLWRRWFFLSQLQYYQKNMRCAAVGDITNIFKLKQYLPGRSLKTQFCILDRACCAFLLYYCALVTKMFCKITLTPFVHLHIFIISKMYGTSNLTLCFSTLKNRIYEKCKCIKWLNGDRPAGFGRFPNMINNLHCGPWWWYFSCNLFCLAGGMTTLFF